MLFSRRAYTTDEKWKRLRKVATEVVDVAARHKVKLTVSPHASIGDVRAALEMQGADGRILDLAFDQLAELGDQEPVRVFPLVDIPATMPAPFAGLAEHTDVAHSLGIGDPGHEGFDHWYLVERSPDGDTVMFQRAIDRLRQRRDPQSGNLITETVTERDELDLRLDRNRGALFTAGGSRNSAQLLTRGLVSYTVGQGITLTPASPPPINSAVLHALVDSFNGKPRRTTIRPNDRELRPWKGVGTFQMDIREHAEMRRMMAQGEQTALGGAFQRTALGASNACPAEVEVLITTEWTFTPETFIEPPMILALYDRLMDLAGYAGLLRPVSVAVAETLAAAGSAGVTPVLIDSAVTDVRAGLHDLGASGRPSAGTSQTLFDIAVLNLLLRAAACTALSASPKRRELDAGALKKIADAVRISQPQRSRVLDILEAATAGSADYMTVLQRGRRMLGKAKC